MAIVAAALLLSFMLLSPVASTAGGGENGAERVTREFFPMDGEVAWVVQVSDLHISAYHPKRAEDMVRLLAPALRAIRPALLLITGDITDAKNKRRTSTRQDKLEWVLYKNTMDAIVRRSGIDKRTIFDIRGNHDKYGVPYVGSDLDFFSIHSISSQLNRLSTIQSISLMGKDRKYMFLGIDDTINIGLRGPSNLFAHPTGRMIASLESELQYWDMYPGTVTKIVFGHFPMSFTASAENGGRYERMFARQSVSAYICGHLHAKFSKQLWRVHTIELASDPRESKKKKQFWEWELGDWKESRLVRILAVDGGQVSFLDFDLPRKTGQEEEFQTTILVTYPIDSRSMNTFESTNLLLRNDINAVVFSAQSIFNVTAKIFDSSRDFKIVEEIPLQLTSRLFHAKWNAENYRSPAATRYWLQVFVLDSLGKETASTLRPFSVEGRMAYYSSTWLAHLVFNVQWEDLYLALLWSNVGFLIILLCLPKILNYFMKRNSSYQRWIMPAFISKSVQQRRILFSVLWFLIEGSSSTKIWSSMVIYLLCLLKLPWFWGYATSENGDIVSMYMFGWRIQDPSNMIAWGYLGTPDIMTITLPFFYMVVTPMILLIYGLFAERSAVCLRHNRKVRCLDDFTSPIFVPELTLELKGVASKASKEVSTSTMSRVFGGWTRKTVLLACMVLMYLHLKLSFALMEFYGRVVASSPALLWIPLLLLSAAIYTTIRDA